MEVKTFLDRGRARSEEGTRQFSRRRRRSPCFYFLDSPRACKIWTSRISVIVQVDRLIKIHMEGMDILIKAERISDLEKMTTDDEGPCRSRQKKRKRSKRITRAVNIPSSEDEDSNDIFLEANSLREGPSNSQTNFNPTTSARDSRELNLTALRPKAVVTSPGHTQVMLMLAKLSHKVDALQATMDMILNKMNHPEELSLSFAQITDVLPRFPLDTVEAVEELEENLNEPNFRNTVYSELRKLGGKGITNLVNKQLMYIFTYSLGVQYSFFGTKNKRTFSSLKLCDIIGDVVRAQLPEKTNEDLKEAIQSWLRHCREKIKKQNK